MKKIIFLLLMTSAMACTTKHTFTPDERALIGDAADAGIMRVLKTDDPDDSLRLRQHSTPLSAEALTTDTYAVLKARMLATVNDPANPGVGIAAPQVGVMRQLIAVQRFDKADEPFEFYVNPRIERYSDEKAIGSEGCLSVPGRSEEVSRAETIVLSYLDEATGQRVEETIDEFTAVIFQHEVDHLNGILYIDRVAETPSTPENDPAE